MSDMTKAELRAAADLLRSILARIEAGKWWLRRFTLEQLRSWPPW